MDWNRVEGNWKQLKGKVKEQWGKLTDDDLDEINGRVDQLDRVVSRRFSSLRVSRRTAAAIQVDGELVEAQADVAIEVKPRALTVLVPVQSDV